MQTKSKFVTMELLHKTTTMPGQKGKFPYLCRMKKETSNNEAYPLTPYTMEEIYAMVKEGEKQFAQGKWQDSEEMFRELEEDFRKEDQEQLVIDQI